MIKYIFCIHTGRCGSNYLAGILKEVQGVTAVHEPDPVMNGRPMIEYLRGNPLAMEQKINEKINSINALIGENKVYIETNHTFIKGFGWFMPSHFPQNEIGVILLKRDKEAIVKSHYRINCRPLNKLGLNWIMNPLMKNPVNSVSYYDRLRYRLLFFIARLMRSRYNPLKFNIDGVKIIQQFDLKYLDWYVRETDAQAERFKKKYPKIKIYETAIDKLNDIREFEKMFDFFELDFLPKVSFSDKLGKKTNLKLSQTIK